MKTDFLRYLQNSPKIIFLLTFVLVTLIACTCGKEISSGSIESQAQLNEIKNDTVYILYDEDSFRKKEFKQEVHPEKRDSIYRINFYLKKKENPKETFWQYMEKTLVFTNDGVYTVPTNNLSVIKRKSVNPHHIISPFFLLSLSNREIFFLLENKIVILLERKTRCEYRGYEVGFGALYFHPE